MIVLSSFTHRIMPRAAALCKSLKDNAAGARAVIYHENVAGDSFPQEVFDRHPWIEWTNLGRADRKGLGKIDSFPEFEAAKKLTNRHTRYFNYHARFWFRKVAAVRACMRANPNESLFLWLDADCVAQGPILSGCVETAKKGDIGYVKRTDKPTDTGIILFGAGNPMVRDFVNEWYDLYASRRVFSELEYWADHYAFDHVMAMPRFSSLKCYDLALCETFRGVVKHMKGHVKMASLRSRR